MPAVHARSASQRPTRDRGTFGDGRFDKTEDFSLYERCITRGIVGSVLPVVYGNGNRIMQAPGSGDHQLRDGARHARHLHRRPAAHRHERSGRYLGDSRGALGRRQLVVETTNLTDQTSIGLNGNGNRHSTQMKMTERFKRVGDDDLQYQVTMDDPVTYTTPFTMSLPLTPLDGGQLLPYECHEGNYALPQSLGAERAEDRALEEDREKGIVRAAASRAGRPRRRRRAGRRRRPRLAAPIAGKRIPARRSTDRMT